MNILAIGDVVGSIGCQFLRQRLPAVKKQMGVDLVIANGENSADGNGVLPTSVRHLYDSGVDVITTGNHSFRRRESYELYDRDETLLRPLNFPKGTTPGRGVCIYDMGRRQVAVVNLMGTAYMENLACPFETMDALLKMEDLPPIVLVDFHAEATGEKRALGYFLDGRVSAVFGTHTHVPTADERVYPKGTGDIRVLGMTGAVESVLGIEPWQSVETFFGGLPGRYTTPQGPAKLQGAVFTLDSATGLCTAVERIDIR